MICSLKIKCNTYGWAECWIWTWNHLTKSIKMNQLRIQDFNSNLFKYELSASGAAKILGGAFVGFSLLYCGYLKKW